VGRRLATCRELFAQLGHGLPHPVYALVGIHPFGRAAAVAALRQAVLGSATARRSYAHYAGPLVPQPAALYRRLRAPAAMATHALTVVDDAGPVVDGDRQALLSYLADPPAGIVLALMLHAPPASPEIEAAIRDVGMLARCAPPAEEDLLEWTAFLARQRAARIEPGAAARLIEYAGPYPHLLGEAIARVVGARGDPITEADVEALAAELPIATTLDLIAAVLPRHRRRATAALGRLLEAGHDSRYVLRSVRRVLEDLTRVRGLLDGGTLHGAIGEALGREPGFYLDRLLAVVHCRRQEQLRRCADLLEKAARDAENGVNTLGKLLVTLCRHSVRQAWPRRALRLWIAAATHR